jgi:hypothetical protein
MKLMYNKYRYIYNPSNYINHLNYSLGNKFVNK